MTLAQAPSDDIFTDTTPVPVLRWFDSGTVGNIVTNTLPLAPPSKAGHAKVLCPCDFVAAGRFRNGARRWWCRTHFVYWGRKAELEKLRQSGQRLCMAHGTLLNEVHDPLLIDVKKETELAIWYEATPVISTMAGLSTMGNIVLERDDPDKPFVSGTTPRRITRHRALSIAIDPAEKWFENPDIAYLHITAPAARDFTLALAEGRKPACTHCSRCAYPHLDLGAFFLQPHRRHYCGNCGHDGSHSKSEIVSTPLCILHDRLPGHRGQEDAKAALKLADYPDCQFALWPTMPALVWQVAAPQIVGIHACLWRDGQVVLDDIFGIVQLGTTELSRTSLLAFRHNELPDGRAHYSNGCY